MPGKLAERMVRAAETKPDHKGDVAIASVWLVLYVLMLVATITAPFVQRALEFAGLY